MLLSLAHLSTCSSYEWGRVISILLVDPWETINEYWSSCIKHAPTNDIFICLSMFGQWKSVLLYHESVALYFKVCGRLYSIISLALYFAFNYFKIVKSYATSALQPPACRAFLINAEDFHSFAPQETSTCYPVLACQISTSQYLMNPLLQSSLFLICTSLPRSLSYSLSSLSFCVLQGDSREEVWDHYFHSRGAQ